MVQWAPSHDLHAVETAAEVPAGARGGIVLGRVGPGGPAADQRAVSLSRLDAAETGIVVAPAGGRLRRRLHPPREGRSGLGHAGGASPARPEELGTERAGKAGRVTAGRAPAAGNPRAGRAVVRNEPCRNRVIE